MRKRSAKYDLGKIPKFLVNAFVWLYSFTCIYPLFWLVISSLKDQFEFFSNVAGFPEKPLFGNYLQAIELGHLDRYMLNSLFYCSVAVFIGILIAMIVGYFTSRVEFRGRSFVQKLFTIGLIIPTMCLLVPMFLQFKALGLRDHWYTMLLPYIAFNMPMSIMLVADFVKTVPRELEEAAIIDGSSRTHVIFGLYMPLCRPILAVTSILQFLYTWNECVFSLVLLKDERLFPISLGLKAYNDIHGVNYPLFMAAMVVALAPVIIVYCFMSKRIMESMTAGAVKG